MIKLFTRTLGWNGGGDGGVDDPVASMGMHFGRLMIVGMEL